MSGHVVATAPRPGAGVSRSILLKRPDKTGPVPGGKPAAVGSAGVSAPRGAATVDAGQREDGGAGQGTGADTWPGTAPRVFVCMYIKGMYMCVFILLFRIYIHIYM